mgnify:CR=1 FL=1
MYNKTANRKVSICHMNIELTILQIWYVYGIYGFK